MLPVREVPVPTRSGDGGAAEEEMVCAPGDGAAGRGPLRRRSACGPVTPGACSAPRTGEELSPGVTEKHSGSGNGMLGCGSWDPPGELGHSWGAGTLAQPISKSELRKVGPNFPLFSNGKGAPFPPGGGLGLCHFLAGKEKQLYPGTRTKKERES